MKPSSLLYLNAQTDRETIVCVSILGKQHDDFRIISSPPNPSHIEPLDARGAPFAILYSYCNTYNPKFGDLVKLKRYKNVRQSYKNFLA